MHYHGHIISPVKREIAKSTTVAIQQPRDPIAQTEILSSLRFCSLLPRFVSNLWYAAALLNKKFARTNHGLSRLQLLMNNKRWSI